MGPEAVLIELCETMGSLSRGLVSRYVLDEDQLLGAFADSSGSAK